ncbi:hypothetical protein THMIRHAM_12910 [Thiomicrorhabdus immobilis]|uniref:Putative gamma-glutamylcyclotransferase n=2 Tax=Thiomicrorhabdus immobilis TaxID=2791037 RepID=A0ABM7MDT3_9GAMM|nr:hypothetical protein THMIRHAM_12910 [Thiomicrorhabdus immobilis]
MNHCFTYGTLMCQEIMQEVCGDSFHSVPGQITGFSRRCIQGEYYPGILASTEDTVEGVLYLDVSSQAWRRLDVFEGEQYQRQWVAVQLENGSTLMAETYVIRTEFIDVLDNKKWSFDDFLKNGKTHFQSQYSGYEAIDTETV